jgi:hypothetical protein
MSYWDGLLCKHVYDILLCKHSFLPCLLFYCEILGSCLYSPTVVCCGYWLSISVKLYLGHGHHIGALFSIFFTVHLKASGVHHNVVLLHWSATYCFESNEWLVQMKHICWVIWARRDMRKVWIVLAWLLQWCSCTLCFFSQYAFQYKMHQRKFEIVTSFDFISFIEKQKRGRKGGKLWL